MLEQLKSLPVGVVTLSGDLNQTNASAIEATLIAALLNQPDSVLLLDMRQVEFMDSTGLAALASTVTVARRLQRRLVFCQVPSAIRLILELTRLDQVIEISDDPLPQLLSQSLPQQHPPLN